MEGNRQVKFTHPGITCILSVNTDREEQRKEILIVETIYENPLTPIRKFAPYTQRKIYRLSIMSTPAASSLFSL